MDPFIRACHEPSSFWTKCFLFKISYCILFSSLVFVCSHSFYFLSFSFWMCYWIAKFASRGTTFSMSIIASSLLETITHLKRFLLQAPWQYSRGPSWFILRTDWSCPIYSFTLCTVAWDRGLRTNMYRTYLPYWLLSCCVWAFHVIIPSYHPSLVHCMFMCAIPMRDVHVIGCFIRTPNAYTRRTDRILFGHKCSMRTILGVTNPLPWV